MAEATLTKSQAARRERVIRAAQELASDGGYDAVQMRDVASRGEVARIRVRVTGTVRAGEVFMPFHWDERCANRLTDDQFDPISREPNYKQCAVRIDSLG